MILNLKKFSESIDTNKIINSDKYISDMNFSIEDKLFFFNHINYIDIIVDFGCADGSTLEYIRKYKNPDIKLIGYDISDDMLNKAKNKNIKNAFFTNSWKEVVEKVNGNGNILLLLNSVIHEIYSYSNGKNIKDFWNNKVFGGLFKYISIRDMIPSLKIDKEENFNNDIEKVRSNIKPNLLNSFEEHWGPIDRDYRNFIHFLLTYRYEENWDRELKENYLPLSLETLKKKIPSNYEIKYEDDFILPFLQQTIQKDFKIKIRHSTHLKLILEQKINKK